MQHLDEGTIHAWLDGALDADTARRVEAHVAACAPCAAAVAEARGLIAASSRILSALDVVPANAARPTSGRAGSSRHRRLSAVARIAAVITIMAISATVATRVIGDRTLAGSARAARGGSRTAATKAVPRANTRTAATAGIDSTATRSTRGTSPTAGTSRVMMQSPRHPMQTPRHAATKIAIAPSERPPRARSAPVVADAERDSIGRPPASTSSMLGGAAPAGTADSIGRRPRLVSAEQRMTSDAREVRRIYEVRPGVRVTLEEVAPVGDRQPRSAERPGDRAAALMAPAPMAFAAPTERASDGGINSIHWTDSTGIRFTLTGPLPVEELTLLKSMIH